MEIRNEQKKFMDDPAVMSGRNCIAARGEYLYNLVEQATKRGLSTEFAHQAIYNWGECIKNRLKNPETTDLKEIVDQLFTPLECRIWEDELTVTEDEARVEFHYCPLLTGFMRNTQDVDKLQELCDIAMECDVGLFNNPRFTYAIEESFFKGDDHCTMIIRRKPEGTDGDKA